MATLRLFGCKPLTGNMNPFRVCSSFYTHRGKISKVYHLEVRWAGNLTYSEFSLFLFGGISCSRFIHFPDLTTAVLVAETFIIDDKVIIAAIHLPFIILILVELLKHASLLLDLKKEGKTKMRNQQSDTLTKSSITGQNYCHSF
uniref:Uncharacterized protein n=1 Tax=Favella ehrenbergii TaxID=182087 RepID=A0A7S3I6X5_9SPIT|mmetsp:Transcript_6403/g.7663  ORF Transcript_6403/g.7663 Transcript_6403/m.7663 type:complete len:144 (+) Transcript_6403:413-844(+)